MQCNAGKLLPAIERLERDLPPKRAIRLAEKLISTLNAQKYEPLWRKLYRLISESQADYPDCAAVFCPNTLLQETRQRIQAAMSMHGYTGNYPDFTKKHSLRGIRLTESYNISYLICGKENTVSHIHCMESYADGHLTVLFLCGTELLRKNESAGDIYSCLFNARRQRFFETVTYDSEYIGMDGETVSDDLNTRVRIAVKLAELLPLTKAERKEVSGFCISNIFLFLFFFVAMGGLFAVLMILGMMLFAVLSCLIVGQPKTIPSMFTELPWAGLFFLAWGGYGGVIAILSVLAKRK